jgi:hypothetical protein
MTIKRMLKLGVAVAGALSMSCCAGAVWAQGPTPGGSSQPIVTYAAQGWSDADRDIFYTTSQGSRILPYAWFNALRRLDVDQPFAGDQLQRYGYLPYPTSKTNPFGLPIGFVVDGEGSSGDIGMTCAACHTAQLEYQKDGQSFALRIDGAPANADFQQFLSDLTQAASKTLEQGDRFTSFAHKVLGSGYTDVKAAQLKMDFGAWVAKFKGFMDASLPTLAWGPGRLDAFGMIFNRVTGLDLDIPANIKVADAPVSYPFLWNASRQDHTQWPGTVPNGLYIQALGRNTGEVFGVFATFSPKLILPGLASYQTTSADFDGLETLEEEIVKLKPPPWPRDVFPIDDNLVTRGKTIFADNCHSCHEEPQGAQIWPTPVKDVGTDPKMAINAGAVASSGLLAGTPMPPPPLFATLPNPAKSADILANAVVGTLLDHTFESGVWRAIQHDLGELLPNVPEARQEGLNPAIKNLLARNVASQQLLISAMKNQLSNFYRKPATADADAAYESRVLHGIWATAPYLHNGSVPNLWELLTPPAQRKPTFTVGSRVFDAKNVGYVTDSSPFSNATFQTDPSNTNGNGNNGHNYGTSLSEDDRWALIEYLKTF